MANLESMEKEEAYLLYWNAYVKGKQNHPV